MSDANLKARCTIDLSFPFHNSETPAEKLRALADYMEAEGHKSEIYHGGDQTKALEDKLADLLGKPAAMWCPTGTMAQGIAAKLYARATGHDRILLHPTSHLELHEEKGYREIHGLEAQMIGELERTLIADDLVDGAACAFVEIPQRHNGGAMPSWSALEAIKERARELSLELHMDGARLWAARDYYDGRTYAEITAGFSSVYVSFYKDIGALGGAVLAGDEAFITEARLLMAGMGGRLVSPWPIVSDSLRLLDKRLEQMPDFIARAKRLATALSAVDGLKISPYPPQSNQMHLRFACDAKTFAKARDIAARQTGVWLAKGVWSLEGFQVSSMELTVGERLLNYPDQKIVDAVKIVLDEIQASQAG